MTRSLTVAALQAHYGPSQRDNFDKTENLIAEAAKAGAQIILPSELFQGIYFCTTQDECWFKEAHPLATHPVLARFRPLAKQLGVVLPLSFYERDNQEYYNSVAVVDKDGEILGVYRKTHIPDGPGYQEKFYFRPGNSGYQVFQTAYAKIGIGICWDQWFPECARSLTLAGAEIIFYPTAIGGEPHMPSMDTKDRWQLAMLGHAVHNCIPVVASNRVGEEKGLAGSQSYYGSSFIANEQGIIVKEINRTDEGVITHTFDLEEIASTRAAWGFFRDRRECDEFRGPR